MIRPQKRWFSLLLPLGVVALSSLLGVVHQAALGSVASNERSDISGDGIVSPDDLFLIFQDERSDINGDGRIDALDVILLLEDWGRVVPTPTATPNETATPTPTPTEIEESALPLEMVSIPAGAFTMGRLDDGNDGAFGGDEELPRHPVNLSAYHIGRFEVTNAQYAEVLTWAHARGELRNSSDGPYNGGDVYANGRILIFLTDSGSFISYSSGVFVASSRQGVSMANHPVTNVTWFGAAAFCNWLSEMEGRTPSYIPTEGNWNLTNRFGNGYRLPSEAEWEYACRGSASNPNRQAPFFFGDDPNLNHFSCTDNAVLDPFMVWCGNDAEWSAPIGSKLPNDYGLYDTHGNVGEWCEDWFQADFYGTDGAVQDNPLCTNAASGTRVARGGSWDRPPLFCRSAYRDRYNPIYRDRDLGLRVVVSLSR